MITNIKDAQIIFEELAKLDDLQYEQIYEEKAKELNVKPSFVTKQVEKIKTLARKENDDIVESIDGFDGSVCGVELADQIESIFDRYVFLPEGGNTAITLWIMGTYVFNSFRIFPNLSITSPERRCGKSSTLDLIEALANKSLLTSNITPAAIFRLIEKYQPTLLIDEADTFVSGRNDDMIGIINSGHAKNRAVIIRTVGDNYDSKKFSTWSPKVFASIKPLQGTVMDRSIEVRLRRKTIHEIVDRLPVNFKDQCLEIRSKLLKWGTDHQDDIRFAKVSLPRIENDRAMDNWHPLFCIAENLDSDWLDKCIKAYKVITFNRDQKTHQIQLLEDIAEIFEVTNYERIFTAELISHLIQMEERPWVSWLHGKPINANALAKMLAGFEIYSSTLRRDYNRKKGYKRSDFEDAFNRYLSRNS
ncbi:DUF3631 domain-containing protein [Francisella sp. LA112445]|uniref:DUF3631 domain-containing protein n=1 Tax=Francisella sp. LA112445 TaxID=1395624 RepID=UPI001788E58C|nr:DUF3631 domain-containing protein [Francisella sp. LA112445]